MPLHLLGISTATEAAGLGTVPFAPPGVHWVGQGPLAAATTARGAALGPLEHARLLAAIFQHINILPARYGDVWPDEEAIRHFLESHGDTLRSQIDRVQGSVEMALRIDLPHPTGGPDARAVGATLPADYLAARRAQYRRQDRLVAQAQWATDIYLRALKGLFRQWRRRSPEPPATLRLAFLVPRPQTAAFAQRVAMLRSMQIGQPCRLFGPWPPYSFG
ncbi:MAG: GvpL/GvpF family gas vesicle protein [Thermoguttaceae bacterium]